MTVQATTACGETYCATVTYSFTVTGGVPPYTLQCGHDSGTLFAVGMSIVTCTASDSEHGMTGNASFMVTVTPPPPGTPPPPQPPYVPPLNITAPADMTVPATVPCQEDYCGQANFTFLVTGGYPPYRLICNHNSGDLFLVGTTTVFCNVEDSTGKQTLLAATFTVTVTPPPPGTPPPPPPPYVPPLSITAPADMTVPATVPCQEDWCGRAIFSYTIIGGHPPYRLICNHNSGDLFLVGTTTVSCNVEDSLGEQTLRAATFTVTVTPPDTKKANTDGSGTTGSATTGRSSGSPGDARTVEDAVAAAISQARPGGLSSNITQGVYAIQ